jgi:hypothetical protein
VGQTTTKRLVANYDVFGTQRVRATKKKTRRTGPNKRHQFAQNKTLT